MLNKETALFLFSFNSLSLSSLFISPNNTTTTITIVSHHEPPPPPTSPQSPEVLEEEGYSRRRCMNRHQHHHSRWRCRKRKDAVAGLCRKRKDAAPEGCIAGISSAGIPRNCIISLFCSAGICSAGNCIISLFCSWSPETASHRRKLHLVADFCIS